MPEPSIRFLRGDDLNDDGEPMQECVFTNHNDATEISLDEGVLVGRAPGTGRGPAVNVHVVPPLYLEVENGVLKLKIEMG